MERNEDETEAITKKRTDRGDVEREREEEYAADAIGGRAGTDFDDEELDSVEESPG